MNVPFLWVGVSFAFGIIAQRCGLCIAGGYLLVAAALAGVSLWFLRGTRAFIYLFLLLVALAGVFRADLDMARPADSIERFVSSRWRAVRGVVLNQPDIRTRGKRVLVSFILGVRSISESSRRSGAKEKKTTGSIQVFWIQPGFIPECGDEMILSGRIERPRAGLNPGQFDHAKYLAEKNIFFVLQPIGPRSGRLVGKGTVWNFGLWTGRLRTGIAALLGRLYPFPQSEILKALVVGVRSNVPADLQGAFMKTGTVHLLAISGLNITMIAGSFFLIFMMMRFPMRLTASLCMMIVTVYIPLAGAGLPVQRAGFMALMVLTAMLLGRAAHLLNALSASFFLLLALDPKSLWNLGFQLSFLSVFSLVTVLPCLPGHRILPLSVGGSFAVLAGTSPLVLYYFNTFSPVSVIANIVAIPIFDASLFTALFAIFFHWVPLLGDVFISLSLGLVSLGLGWIRWLSLWRYGYWFFVRPEAWQLWAYYGTLGAILMMSRVRFPFRKIGAAIFLAAWAATAISMLRVDSPRRFCLTVLATGREPVLHAHFPDGSDWLVNTGRNFPSDQGERIVVPYLRHRGIKSLEGILLTDFRKKHCGGLGAVLRDVAVRRIVGPDLGPVPGEIERLAGRNGALCVRAKKEMRIGPEDASMSVLEITDRGMAVLFDADPGKIIFLSDAEFFGRTDFEHDSSGIVITPFLNDAVAGRIWEEMAATNGKAVIAGAAPGVVRELGRARIEYFDLSQCGALTIMMGESGSFSVAGGK